MAASSSVAHIICVIYVFNKLSQIVRNETTNGNNRIGDIELILFIKWIKILSRFVQWIGMLKCRSKADIQNQTTKVNMNRLNIESPFMCLQSASSPKIVRDDFFF